MTETVVIGNATLIHGDCREVLPGLPKFDLILTDPPYGLGLGKPENNKRGLYGKQTGKEHESVDWDVAPPDAAMLCLLRQAAAAQILWGANYYADKLPCSRGWIVWDKMNDAFYSTSDGEVAWSNVPSRLRFFRRPQGLDKGFVNRDPFGNVHPTQKPLALMLWCINVFMKNHPPQTVIDPFVGSGTTGVACAQLGKTFTGIEKERKYFDIACQRIARAQAQGQMFPDEPARVLEQQGLDL